ncbi:phytanoyl-CoA dioxygenase family protein [Kordiimonas gwangyangensis]|uniref:phytanoyl-CoA dioxygenase family protein n=1 Tax=Kordiimonas gwangyangensis TaxID=288022 RepID=UPI00037620BD|nr:phytanoyl-CoA dioxygenase family protein [Kordiimonas gwangyangensis]
MKNDIFYRNMPLFMMGDVEAIAVKNGWSPLETEVATSLARDGYAVLDFPDDTVDELASAVIADLEGLYKPPHNKVLNGFRLSSAAKRIATNQKVLDLLSKIYGRVAFPFQTLNFSHGSEQHIHSDAVHFNSFPRNFMCGVWVALEDITESNGPLEYYPGSQNHSYVDYAELGMKASAQQHPYELYCELEQYWAWLVASFGWRRELLTCKKGTALIWAANLLHGGSMHHNKGETRYSQVTHYYFDDCTYYTPLQTDFILGKANVRRPFDIVRGEFRESMYVDVTIDPENYR